MIKFKEYWWVNQNQTYQSEIKGYMWSPKKKRNGDRNEYYDNMTKATIGDAVFSFAASHIKAIGIIKATAKTRNRPSEFDDQWDLDGWYVGVNWLELEYPFRPKKYIEALRPLLPNKYSPLQTNGNGNQGVYLTRLESALGNKLLEITVELNSDIDSKLKAFS
jgi:putative restriction endonuclease